MYKVPVNRYVERHGSVKLRGLRLSRGGGDYRIPRTALPLGLKYYRVTCRIYFSFIHSILAEEKLTKHRTNAYVSVRPLSHTHTPHSALSLTRSVKSFKAPSSSHYRTRSSSTQPFTGRLCHTRSLGTCQVSRPASLAWPSRSRSLGGMHRSTPGMRPGMELRAAPRDCPWLAPHA